VWIRRYSCRHRSPAGESAACRVSNCGCRDWGRTEESERPLADRGHDKGGQSRAARRALAPDGSGRWPDSVWRSAATYNRPALIGPPGDRAPAFASRRVRRSSERSRDAMRLLRLRASGAHFAAGPGVAPSAYDRRTGLDASWSCLAVSRMPTPMRSRSAAFPSAVPMRGRGAACRPAPVPLHRGTRFGLDGHGRSSRRPRASPPS